MFTHVLLAMLVALASAQGSENCKNIKIPLELSARNGVFDIPVPTTDIEVTSFILNFTRSGANFTQEILKDYQTVSGKYELAATYCEPASSSQRLQILTHGIGFDRSYWDYPFNNHNYSYTKRALEEGFATLSYDRLGISESPHGDPLSEIQMFLEISALKGVTNFVKEGNLEGGKHRDSKLVHVGHSFGSVLTYALTADNTNITDAIILQGWSQAPSFTAQFILGSNFVPAKQTKPSYADGYFASSRVGNMIDFFAPGNFDPMILNSSVSSGQPVTAGELLTMGAIPMKSGFKGPVLIITGEKDVPFCGGNCTNAMAAGSDAKDILAMSKPNFKSASNFKTTIIPGTGHAMNLAFSAQDTYKAMLDFLKSAL